MRFAIISLHTPSTAVVRSSAEDEERKGMSVSMMAACRVAGAESSVASVGMEARSNANRRSKSTC